MTFSANGKLYMMEVSFIIPLQWEFSLYLGCFIVVVLGAPLETNGYEYEKGLKAVVMLVIEITVSVA